MRSEASRLSQYSISTLQWLEEQGKLIPMRLANRTRVYTQAQIDWLNARRERLAAAKATATRAAQAVRG
jgi:DNA-binding transcriptional MerR regulator